MAEYIAGRCEDFVNGLAWITHFDDDNDIGIGIGILRLNAGDNFQLTVDHETAFLLMSGKVRINFDHESVVVERASIFNEAATCLHACQGLDVTIECLLATEFTLYQTANRKVFPCKLYRPEDVDREQRGKGQVGDTCWREVRTIFGIEDNNIESDMVLGEVITFPGRWSSYPPHHHSQPEIYHYRFMLPQGYGHAELGEDVFKVGHYDTIKIHDLKDHAQCAAPGYGMYYSWVIRHLPGDRYVKPEFTKEHTWVMDPEVDYWLPNVADSRD